MLLIATMFNKNRLLGCQATPPESLLPWLTHQYSLTNKLKKESGDACLQVLNQTFSLSNWWDIHHLHLLHHQQVLHRDIVMYSKHRPCWYARTIFPEQTYQYNQWFFDKLQHEPLGELIFNSDRINRLSLSHYQINNKCIEYYWLDEAMHCYEKELWARFSVFSIDDSERFFLIELLLPGLLSCLI